MRRLAGILTAISLLAGAATAELVKPEGKAPYYSSYDEALAAAAAKDQPVAIKFYTDW